MAQEEIVKSYMGSSVSMRVSLKQRRERFNERREVLRLLYRGGQDPVTRLRGKSGESLLSWLQRRENFRNVRFIAHIVDTYAGLLYAKPPRRTFWVGEKPPSLTAQVLARTRGETLEIDPDDETIQDIFTKIYTRNAHGPLFLKAAQTYILEGVSAMKVWLDEGAFALGEDAPIRMDIMDGGDAIPILDPDDPDTVIGAWEMRGARWRLWNHERWDWVNDDGSLAPGNDDSGQMHSLGRVPFVWLGGVDAYGKHISLWLDDAVTMQDRLINRESTNYAVTRAQGFPVPVLKSIEPLANPVETDPRTGEQGHKMGWDQLVEITDPNGNFWFANPNANLEQLLSMYHADWQEGLRTHGLPDNVTATAAGVEQPMAMRFRWMAALGRRDHLIAIAEDFERGVSDIIWRWVNEWVLGGSFAQEEFQAEIRFPGNPFPEDERAEMDSDMRKVASGLMLKADFVLKHVLPAMSNADDVAQYLEALAEENKVGSLNGLEPPMPQLNIPGLPLGRMER
jgi:hypothetical protein